MTITIPPLAHRKCDIFPLIQAFTKAGKRLAFAPGAKEYLLAHGWPGNTRELKRFVEIMATGADGQVTLEAVKRHVTHSAPPELPGSISITQQQYDHALKHGLPDAIDRITAGIINRNLAENNGKKIDVREQLKISKRLLYSVLDKGQKKEKVQPCWTQENSTP
jgi:DNA-binding NtrC family response regulator